jgi:hypothetical protein
MFLHPEAAETELLGLLAEAAQPVACDIAAELGQGETDLHGRSRNE